MLKKFKFFSLIPTKECGPFEESAVVIQIKDHSFDVLIVNLGISKRIYCDVSELLFCRLTRKKSQNKWYLLLFVILKRLDIEQDTIKYVKSELKPEISFFWRENETFKERVEQKLELFSIVNVVLTGHENDPLKFNVQVKHPKESLNKLGCSRLADKIAAVGGGGGGGDNKGEEDQILVNQRIDMDPYVCD
jgi:hypothetical protein